MIRIAIDTAPHIKSIYSELKGWQGAIGSVLGFFALISGALFNYRLNRLRDKSLRGEEVKSIAAAFYAEIIALRIQAARTSNAVANRYFAHGLGTRRGEPYDEHFVEQYSLASAEVYPKLLDKVGMLPPQMTLAVARFYESYKQTAAWLPRLENVDGRGFTYSLRYVLDPAASAVREIEPTLRDIEALCGMNTCAVPPSLKLSDDAIENERDMWEE